MNADREQIAAIGSHGAPWAQQWIEDEMAKAKQRDKIDRAAQSAVREAMADGNKRNIDIAGFARGKMARYPAAEAEAAIDRAIARLDIMGAI